MPPTATLNMERAWRVQSSAAVVRRSSGRAANGCARHGLVSHGEPAYTSAGNLPCRYVIHAVGPVWGEGDEEGKLAAAILGSLKLAERLNLTSIAFPAISTGIFRFPIPLAAQVMLAAIRGYLADNPTSRLELIRLVLFDRETWQAFADAVEQNDHLGP